MKEVKRTYQFEHEYTHGLTGYPATVSCEIEIDYAKKQWAIDNLTAHLLHRGNFYYRHMVYLVVHHHRHPLDCRARHDLSGAGRWHP